MPDGGLSSVFKFKYYANRDEAKKAGINDGVVMPTFNPTLLRKSWFDPNPPAPDEEGNVVYDVVAHTSLGTVKLRDGKPYYTKLRLTPYQARTMNLQPQGPPEFVNIGEVPIPCRELAPDEEFTPNGFSGWKVVKKGTSKNDSMGTPAADYTARFDSIDAQLRAITEQLLSK